MKNTPGLEKFTGNRQFMAQQDFRAALHAKKLPVSKMKDTLAGAAPGLDPAKRAAMLAELLEAAERNVIPVRAGRPHIDRNSVSYAIIHFAQTRYAETTLRFIL